MANPDTSPHFISRNHAINYFKQFGIKKDDVKKKIALDEVVIGQPKVAKDQKLIVDKDGRYEVVAK